MREYEVTIIIQPKLEEEPRNEIIERVTGWLVGGEVTDDNRPTTHHWGSRKMAYAIRNHKDGYYIHFEVNLDPQRIPDIERNMQYTEDLLRYLVVRKES
ncbi:MAG: 30S ribosomal protein S6 [Chloroflexota bacterium]